MFSHELTVPRLDTCKKVDPLLLSCDEAFKKHINTQAVKAGLVQDSEVDGAVDPNVAMQLFAPLVASQRSMMAHIKNPYQTLKCVNGFLFVFEQFHDQMQVAVSANNEDTVCFMRRKLLVFQKIISFLFGPVHEEIRPSHINDRNKRWHFLSSLMDTWCHLYKEEQSFLFDAIERLHVNQMLNAKCIDLLERSLSGMKAAGEKNIMHAMLVVNTKLLALYSNHKAIELQSADILLIILLVRTRFPTNQKLEDLFSVSYHAVNEVAHTGLTDIKTGDGDSYESASEGKEEDSEFEYFSTPSTPGGSPKLESFKIVNQKDYEFSSSSSYIPAKAGDNLKTDVKETSLDKKLKVSFESGAIPGISNFEEKDFYENFTVLLGTPACTYTPHVIHCIEILPGTVLILISEVSRGRQSGSLCQILSLLQKILNQTQQEHKTGKGTIDAIDGSLRKVQDVVRKLKGSTACEKCLADVILKWDMVKKNGLLGALEKQKSEEIPPRIESTLSHIYEKMKYLFRLLYLLPWRLPPDVQQKLHNGIEKCKQMLQQELWDYKDYLAVKAQRNIAVTSYVEEFPGLVHFVYVDRTSHQMVAPSINITDELDTDDIDMKLKKKIQIKMWETFPEIQNQACKGFLSQSIKQGDLLFSYFLWIEDAAGNHISPQQSYQSSSDNILPGILAGNFYRSVMQQTLPNITQRHLYCFELLTVHIALVPSHMVIKHARNLSNKLFELTSEANSHISLL